ncbi:hypothetical protein ACS0TY_027618 [Phlomoides rotata]
MTSLYRELYGPQDTSVLTFQDIHRSEALYKKKIQEDDTLRTNHTTSNIFWTFRPDDQTRVRLHSRVLDVLHDMGFYHVARCGLMVVDNHLITALVERWRPETHTFHFPVGEATVTLQDVAIIWGLHIDGQPLCIDDHNKTEEEWQWNCLELLGFHPDDSDFKSKTRLKLSSIKNHCMRVEITDDTEQDIVNQYARGCVLLMLGSFVMPDSSRSHVSLLYLLAIENIEAAGCYSWGSAVLAYLYRELCNAAEWERSTIGGPLSILQIWAWSRISTIQPVNLGNKLLQGPLFGVGGRNLGLPPYGIRWTTHHSHTHSTRHSVRVYRDVFDRMNDGDFYWDVYDMTLPEITSLDDRCLTLNWMSECPLISMCIVELHHPNRVLRQFGCKQNIPPVVDDTHNHTHHISFHGRDGCDWRRYHRRWIDNWDLRQPLTNTMSIHGNSSLINGYMQWYRRITRLLISPSRYESTIGYQSTDTAARDQVIQMMEYLNLAATEASIENRQSFENLRHTAFEVATETIRLLTRPPYRVDPPVTDGTQSITHGPYIDGTSTVGPSTAEPSTAGPSTSINQRQRNQTDEFGASTSRSQRRRSSASQDSS